MDDILEPLKAWFPIVVTVLGMTVVLHPMSNVLVAVSTMPLQLSRLSYFAFALFTSIEFSLSQPQFVAHIDNQRVAYNKVEKSCRECFEDVKSCRFNDFNFILQQMPIGDKQNIMPMYAK